MHLPLGLSVVHHFDLSSTSLFHLKEQARKKKKKKKEKKSNKQQHQ